MQGRTWLFVALMATALGAQAQMYRCVLDGKKVYQNHPCQGAATGEMIKAQVAGSASANSLDLACAKLWRSQMPLLVQTRVKQSAIEEGSPPAIRVFVEFRTDTQVDRWREDVLMCSLTNDKNRIDEEQTKSRYIHGTARR
ncbi:MAG: DUF4124 domain-containing protein [Zoogloeaceae bacterium]|jgi:hypothetical protein|nr:DUF4124 domain-containing protein [Zoogloeaceae bacterium]